MEEILQFEYASMQTEAITTTYHWKFLHLWGTLAISGV